MHTKGPWKMESLTLDFADYWRISPDYPCYKRIGLVYRSGKDGEANARLVTAAPELLKELEEGLDILCHACKVHNPQHENCTSCIDTDSWREAIRKAKEGT